MKAQKVWFENGHICIITAEGREGNLPVRLFPRLYKASEEQLQNFTLSHYGIHWPNLDEDLSYEGFFSEENSNKDKSILSKLFFQFPELNRLQVARIAGINSSLFQQYIDGFKTPSAERMKDIEDAIKKLGRDLSNISLQ
ncbi:MAG: DUF2442 domain-containing protein [Bacteroidaceae bacterium]|nr:DUF2442 domain-containing protein [Bacteroidaceae bacterium]